MSSADEPWLASNQTSVSFLQNPDLLGIVQGSLTIYLFYVVIMNCFAMDGSEVMAVFRRLSESELNVWLKSRTVR